MSFHTRFKIRARARPWDVWPMGAVTTCGLIVAVPGSPTLAGRCQPGLATAGRCACRWPPARPATGCCFPSPSCCLSTALRLCYRSMRCASVACPAVPSCVIVYCYRTYCVHKTATPHVQLLHPPTSPRQGNTTSSPYRRGGRSTLCPTYRVVPRHMPLLP